MNEFNQVSYGIIYIILMFVIVLYSMYLLYCREKFKKLNKLLYSNLVRIKRENDKIKEEIISLKKELILINSLVDKYKKVSMERIKKIDKKDL
jgi:hypothetical protein